MSDHTKDGFRVVMPGLIFVVKSMAFDTWDEGGWYRPERLDCCMAIAQERVLYHHTPLLQFIDMYSTCCIARRMQIPLGCPM